MEYKKINPFITWWVTPKLPHQDVFGLPLLMGKSPFAKFKHLLSHWFIHPFKRRLAKWYLKFLQSFTDIKVIAVTGSAGKSTTVQIIASILRLSGNTLATPPSIDPIFNVPNTILKSSFKTKFLVLEESVEYPGEMDYYLWLATPDVGVIVNIFPTHTQHLGSVFGVLKEKGKLVLNLKETGVAVLNQGDERLREFSKKVKAKVLWFENGSNSLDSNTKAAEVVAKHFGVDVEKIKEGTRCYQRPRHRLEIIKHKSGAVILDDSYNSNPGAVLATLSYFNKLAGKNSKVAVLGDMLELGDIEESVHRQIGKMVVKDKFKIVIGVGKASKYLIDEVNERDKKIKTYLVPDVNEVLGLVKPFLSKNTYVLVKGSRSIGLDKLVSQLS